MNFEEFIKKADKTKEWLSEEYVQLFSNTANPAMLDGIKAEAYGSNQPIKNIATITIEDNKTLLVSPWDKTLLKSIEQAITNSNIDFSLSTGDSGIRAIIPTLTTERKEIIKKLLKEKLEEARKSIKLEREKYIGIIKEDTKNKELSEDKAREAKEELQELVNKYNKELAETHDNKLKSISS